MWLSLLTAPVDARRSDACLECCNTELSTQLLKWLWHEDAKHSGVVETHMKNPLIEGDSIAAGVQRHNIVQPCQVVHIVWLGCVSSEVCLQGSVLEAGHVP